MAVVFAISVLVLGKVRRARKVCLRWQMMPEEKVVLKTKHGQKAPENMSAFQIFCTYVLRNKNAGMSPLWMCLSIWCVSA